MLWATACSATVGYDINFRAHPVTRAILGGVSLVSHIGRLVFGNATGTPFEYEMCLFVGVHLIIGIGDEYLGDRPCRRN